nr:MAG: hypothetical protein [Molluscum contagiosum virus]
MRPEATMSTSSSATTPRWGCCCRATMESASPESSLTRAALARSSRRWPRSRTASTAYTCARSRCSGVSAPARSSTRLSTPFCSRCKLCRRARSRAARYSRAHWRETQGFPRSSWRTTQTRLRCWSPTCAACRAARRTGTTSRCY